MKRFGTRISHDINGVVDGETLTLTGRFEGIKIHVENFNLTPKDTFPRVYSYIEISLHNKRWFM